MDDYSEFFNYYSQPNLCIDDQQRNTTEMVDRSRCAVCQALFKVVPRDEERCWCINCGASLSAAVQTVEKTYRMTDVLTHKPLGVFLGYSGYCAILRDRKLKPMNVETDHPNEPEMAERWYTQYAKGINKKR